MDGFSSFAPLNERIEDLNSREFTLVDVGCGGGIAPSWKYFGKRLRAYGFDADVSEIERLNQENDWDNIEYVAGMVRLASNHPLHDKVCLIDPPWQRLSLHESNEIIGRINQSRKKESEELLDETWLKHELSTENIDLLKFLEKENVNELDFLKVDIDGVDYEVLLSVEPLLRSQTILGVGIEVNFSGSSDEDQNSFHNIDRFMKSNGYDLFGLTTNKFSRSALPAKYLGPSPTKSNYGQVLQGDALYLLDLVTYRNKELGESMSTSRLIDLFFLYSMFDLHDCAAELFLAYKDRFEESLDSHYILNILAHQIQGNIQDNIKYKEYMEMFKNNDPYFYGE